MKLFDSHAHYNDEKFDIDREKVLEEIWQTDVKRIVNAGYDVLSSKRAIEFAEQYPEMYAICGLSPNDLPQMRYGIGIDTEKQILKKIEQIAELVSNKKVVAIGEIGLDYHWNKENKDMQKLAFRKQIELANQQKLPIAIHSRDAWEDTIAILKENPVTKLGVFHCCQLNRELVRNALELGYYISLAGYITFTNATNADDVIRMVPIEKLMIETDSPYMSPEPNRGTRNDSRNLVHIVQKIAEIKEMEPEKVAEQTFKNASKLYGIRNSRKKKVEQEILK